MFEIPTYFQIPLVIGGMCGVFLGLFGKKEACLVSAFSTFVIAGVRYQWSVMQWFIGIFGILIGFLFGVVLKKIKLFRKWISEITIRIPRPSLPF